MTVIKRTIACVGALLLAVTLSSCGQSAAPEEVANYLVEFQQPFVGREARDASELDAIVQNALEIAGDRESKIASDSEEGEQAKRMNNKFDMANDAYKKGDYAEAQRLYEAVLENVHGHYGANVNLTLALLQQNKNDEALAQALACCHTFPEEPEPLLNVQVAGAACGFHVDDVESAADNVLQDAGSSLETLRAELTDEYDNFYIYNQVWDRIETDLHVQAEGDEGDAEASAPEKPEYATYTALGVDLAVLGDELVDDSDVAALDAYYHAVGLQLGFEADPHQISPVLKVDLWESESIYTMVKLSSFERPTTVPHPYKVTLLGTQYRSVPAIGQVFSEFSYDGMLKNARNGWDANRAYLGKELGGQAISIIRFPVSPYESIYKPKQLDHKSAYQPYAAILTFELVKHLVGRLETEGTSRKTSIGIVSPYRAQADLLAGLLGQIRLPEQVTVQAGTIHGFQGDECDLMIVVLNTPPSISRKPGMFLNRRNILNVSVSRAKDSLILLVPDENTKDLDRLREVNRLRSICQRTGSVKEFSSSSIEKQLFGSETFIEGNCFSTGHQSVNVYGRPEQRYEIRSESQAVDIQVHDEPNHQGRQEEASSQAHTHSTAPATTVPSVISSSASQKQDSINNQASRTIRPSASQASTSQALQRQSTTGPSHPTKPLPWGIEELRRLKANYKLYMDVPRTLQTLFPNRTLREIDVKAVELRIVDRLPVRTGVKQQNPANTQRTTGRTVGPSAKQQPQARKSDKERERERMRKRPWDASEIAILRRNYPKYGSDMKKWDQMLQYRQKKAIEAQAHKLGLA